MDTKQSPTSWGSLFFGGGGRGVVNCLVVFPTHFNPNNSLSILLQISLLFMWTPALNSCHSNIEFTIEFEQDNATPFLDILFTRKQDSTFMTSIYRKRTFTGLYTKWDFFTPRNYRINVIRSLSYRCYRLCSSGSLLQSALNVLRKLLQNGSPGFEQKQTSA